MWHRKGEARLFLYAYYKKSVQQGAGRDVSNAYSIACVGCVRHRDNDPQVPKSDYTKLTEPSLHVRHHDWFCENSSINSCSGLIVPRCL